MKIQSDWLVISTRKHFEFQTASMYFADRGLLNSLVKFMAQIQTWSDTLNSTLISGDIFDSFVWGTY